MENYKDGFQYKGSLSKTHCVSVKPRVTPVITAARRVPIDFRGKLKGELDRLITLNVLESITKPTQLVSPLVSIGPKRYK